MPSRNIDGFGVDSFQINAPGMTPERLNRLLVARGIQGIGQWLAAGRVTQFDGAAVMGSGLGGTLRQCAAGQGAQLPEFPRLLPGIALHRSAAIVLRQTGKQQATGVGVYLVEQGFDLRRRIVCTDVFYRDDEVHKPFSQNG